MTYIIANYDHLPIRDVTISLMAVPDKYSKKTVLKLVLHSKENKVILTLSDEQADKVASLIDDYFDPEVEKEA